MAETPTTKVRPAGLGSAVVAPDMMATMADLKAAARKEDDEREAAIKSLSPEQQEFFMTLPPGRQTQIITGSARFPGDDTFLERFNSAFEMKGSQIEFLSPEQRAEQAEETVAALESQVPVDPDPSFTRMERAMEDIPTKEEEYQLWKVQKEAEETRAAAARIKAAQDKAAAAGQ